MAVNFLTNKDKAEIEGKLGTKASKADVAELLAKAAKVEIGSYTGGGSYGSSAPNRYTFDDSPQMVIICSESHNTWGMWVNGCNWLLQYRVGVDEGNKLDATLNDNTLTWYIDTDANEQLNHAGYKYMVVGFTL